MPGTVRYPHVVLKRADMFVSSSELEGFPMALCEAMACGLPVIATEYHSAVREIIEDGQNGILVPTGDSEALAATMIHLIKDPGERKRLAGNSVEIGLRYSVDAVMERWEQLLKEVKPPERQAACLMAVQKVAFLNSFPGGRGCRTSTCLSCQRT